MYESSHFYRVVVIATVFGDSTGVLNFCYQHVRVNIFNVAENSGCLNHHFYLEVAYLATIFRTMQYHRTNRHYRKVILDKFGMDVVGAYGERYLTADDEN